MLEKSSIKLLSAASLGSVLLLAFVLSTQGNALALDSGDGVQALDKFGIEKIYPTKDGREWYVNMDDPRDDPFLKNIGSVNFVKNADGSWKISNPSRGQIRMEAWSPANEKWHNVEITAYAKIESGPNQLLQLYSRGGHHSNSDQCSGSAYKARLYGDGRASWTKEVTHPAYAGNRGVKDVTNEPLQGRWVGFKAVIYNFEVNGKTYVRLESYVDDKVTGAAGNLIVGNNWKLASVVEDRGGWRTENSDFNSSCGKARDAILTAPGGSGSQNIAGFRSDGLVWSFKYLNVREIDPIGLTPEELVPQPVPEEIINEAPDTDPETSVLEQNNLCGSAAASNCKVIASRRYEDNNNIAILQAITLELMRTSSYAQAQPSITVAVVQEDRVLTTQVVGTGNIGTRSTLVFINLDIVANVGGQNFEVFAFSEDTGIDASVYGVQYMKL